MNTLRNYIFRDDFVKKSLFFFIATGLISFVNYVYHPILGNLIPVTSFGEVETLFSLYNVFGIFLFAFTSVVIHVTANIQDENERNKFLAKIGITGISFSITLALVTTATSPLLTNIFHFSSPTPFIIFASLLPFATYVFFGTAFFQGQKNVKPFALSHALVSILKLALAVAFIYVGARVLGVMVGFLTAQVFGAIYISRALKGKIRVFHKNADMILYEKEKLFREIRYGTMIFIANFSVILFCNGDILTVKYFFNPETAGLYSGISAIGNIVYFATTPIAAMLLASVKLKNTKKENQRVLYLALGACLIFVVLAVLIFSLGHSIIITLLLGSKFTKFSPILRPISLIMGLSAIYNIMLMYFLALRKKTVFVPALISFGTLIVLLILRHQSIVEVVHNFIAAIIAGIIVSSAWLLWHLYLKQEQHGIA